MGRAIDMENRQDDFDRRLKLVEGALEELVQTKIHHVDLHESTKEVLSKSTEIKPDETFEKPKAKKRAKAKAESA
tara:strand:- start:257 stop:481 length:225 start_codon:yes stop_codon:yes gene_type:complete